MSLGIRGLPFDSLTESEDDVGVLLFEPDGDGPWLGELDAAPPWPEEDDDPEGFSFFLEDLLESFARDSCSC